MHTQLDTIIINIGNEFKDQISPEARNYLEIDIGKRAASLGFAAHQAQFANVQAIVPLKEPQSGMKVRIDGRTFKNYRQFASGVAVPGYVAQASGLPGKNYSPNDSMILNFT